MHVLFILHFINRLYTAVYFLRDAYTLICVRDGELGCAEEGHCFPGRWATAYDFLLEILQTLECIVAHVNFIVKVVWHLVSKPERIERRRNLREVRVHGEVSRLIDEVVRRQRRAYHSVGLDK